MPKLIRILQIIWVLPNTLLGLLVGFVGLPFGGRMQIRRGCVEFYGGLVQKLLRMSFTGVGTMAMTLGHTIIGQTDASLDIARNHEHVHVRQYEKWGPLFIPAYLFMSLWMWIKGKDPYRDNPFEVEAYGIDDPFG